MENKERFIWEYPESTEENKAYDYFLSDPNSERMPSIDEIK